MIKNFLNICILVTVISGSVFAQSLDNYINTALKNSPWLFDFNNQKLAGQLDSLLLIAAFKPQVSQISQIMHPPTGSGWGYDESITNGGNYSSVINLTQTLFNKKQINGQLQNLSLLNQTLKINEKITIIDLKKSITAQYLTSYSDYAQHQFNHTMLLLLNKQLKTIKVLVDKGIYLMTDYMNLQVAITAQKISISQSFIKLKNDIAFLNYICGVQVNLTSILLNLRSLFKVFYIPKVHQ